MTLLRSCRISVCFLICKQREIIVPPVLPLPLQGDSPFFSTPRSWTSRNASLRLLHTPFSSCVWLMQGSSRWVESERKERSEYSLLSPLPESAMWTVTEFLRLWPSSSSVMQPSFQWLELSLNSGITTPSLCIFKLRGCSKLGSPRSTLQWR